MPPMPVRTRSRKGGGELLCTEKMQMHDPQGVLHKRGRRHIQEIHDLQGTGRPRINQTSPASQESIDNIEHGPGRNYTLQDTMASRTQYMLHVVMPSSMLTQNEQAEQRAQHSRNHRRTVEHSRAQSAERAAERIEQQNEQTSHRQAQEAEQRRLQPTRLQLMMQQHKATAQKQPTQWHQHAWRQSSWESHRENRAQLIRIENQAPQTTLQPKVITQHIKYAERQVKAREIGKEI